MTIDFVVNDLLYDVDVHFGCRHDASDLSGDFRPIRRHHHKRRTLRQSLRLDRVAPFVRRDGRAGKPPSASGVSGGDLRQGWTDVRRRCQDALAGRLETHQSVGESKQWFHPTIWSYLWTGTTKGIW